jgi:peroxiredoxin
MMKRVSTWVLSVVATWVLVWAGAAASQPALVIKPLAEKKMTQLPVGPLFWRLETFATLAQAQAAAGASSLVAESRGQIWLFTLGPASGSTPGGTKVAEIGPLPPVAAAQYLLRINEASGPPGSVTPVHTHPGSETFYVLAGEQSIRTPHGVMRVEVGKPETGHGADVPMQVSSSGSSDLHALVMFVVDATRPFSSPAKFAALDVGDKAPDFTLPSTNGEKISLSQFRGKKVVLLEFYGGDFSPVCAANLSARKADYGELEALGVQVLGISSNNPFSQKTFADSLKLPFPLLSDFPNLTVIRSYGGLNPSLAVTTAQRSFFLIDKEGIVRGQWSGSVTEVFASAPLLRAVRALAGK